MKLTSTTLRAGIVVSALSLAAIAGIALSSASPSSASAASAAAVASTPDAASLVERGEHLVLTSGCSDCHTPLKLGANGPEPDMSRMLSGHPEAFALPPAPPTSGPWLVSGSATGTAWSGPWGVSHTANLTPDLETGLGKWTEEEFISTIRTGRHLGRGRAILPPMPIPAYSNFTTDELKAIFAYLRTIPVIQNRVPAPLPPAPTAG